MWKYFLLNRKNKIGLRKIAWNAETQEHRVFLIVNFSVSLRLNKKAACFFAFISD